MNITQKINIWVQGFIYCALIASITANIAMYQGFLINKSKLNITICTAVAEAVNLQGADEAEMNALTGEK